MKKALIVASALAAVLSTSAFAQTSNEPNVPARHAARKVQVLNGRYMAVPQATDPYTVIENDRVVGRDPDANVRTQLRRDFIPNEY